MLKWLCTLSTLTPSTPMSSALGVVITSSGKEQRHDGYRLYSSQNDGKLVMHNS